MYGWPWASQSAITSGVHSKTVRTLRRLGGDPFLALP